MNIPGLKKITYANMAAKMNKLGASPEMTDIRLKFILRGTLYGNAKVPPQFQGSQLEAFLEAFYSLQEQNTEAVEKWVESQKKAIGEDL